jgi:hypothetical protein
MIPSMPMNAEGEKMLDRVSAYYDLLEKKVAGAFDNNDLLLARKLQQKLIDLIMLLGNYGGIATKNTSTRKLIFIQLIFN